MLKYKPWTFTSKNNTTDAQSNGLPKSQKQTLKETKEIKRFRSKIFFKSKT